MPTQYFSTCYIGNSSHLTTDRHQQVCDGLSPTISSAVGWYKDTAKLPTGSSLRSVPPTKPQPSCGRAPGSTGPQLLTRTRFCQEDSLPRDPSQLMSIIGPLLPQPWIFKLESWCNSKNSQRAKDLIHAAFSAAFWQPWHSITHWPNKVLSFTDLVTIKKPMSNCAASDRMSSIRVSVSIHSK